MCVYVHKSSSRFSSKEVKCKTNKTARNLFELEEAAATAAAAKVLSIKPGVTKASYLHLEN